MNNDPYKNGINAVKVENIFAKLEQCGSYDSRAFSELPLTSPNDWDDLRGDPGFEKLCQQK